MLKKLDTIIYGMELTSRSIYVKITEIKEVTR